MTNVIKKKNLIKLYNLPKEVIHCKKCTISNQRPRITFDKEGVCSACNFAIYKKNKINWKEREAELLRLCDKFRRRNGEYDVVVPCSGGKDGSFVAHQLKFKYNMNPLCVTWSPLRYTEIGKKNLENFIQSGFGHILGTPDPKITRKLTELSFKEVGDPFQPFIYGQANFPLDIALKFKINLIMYGENGEVEYGGDKKNAHKPTQELNDRNKHYFSNMPAEIWEKYGIKKLELKPFLCPDLKLVKENKTEIHFFGYYKFWDPQENFYYVIENCNFTTNPERNEMTHTKYASLDDRFDAFHYYLSYIKFGLARVHSDTAHEIRDDKINRDEGISLVKKFENEFPKKYYKEFLEFCSLDDDTFTKIIDSWRSEHIWFKDNHGVWKLKNPVWK